MASGFNILNNDVLSVIKTFLTAQERRNLDVARQYALIIQSHQRAITELHQELHILEEIKVMLADQLLEEKAVKKGVLESLLRNKAFSDKYKAADDGGKKIMRKQIEDEAWVLAKRQIQASKAQIVRNDHAIAEIKKVILEAREQIGMLKALGQANH